MSLESVFGIFQIFFLLSILSYSAISDIRYRRVSNAIIILAIVFRLLFLIFISNKISLIKFSLLGGLGITIPLMFIILFFEKVLKKQVMGGADIKLIFICGFYLGVDLTLHALLLSFSIASVVGIINNIKKRNKHYPFAPSLAIGTFLAVLLPTAVK